MEALPLLEFAYNNSPHSVTKISPFKAVQGTDPIVPASLLLPVDTGMSQPQSCFAYCTDFVENLYQCRYDDGRCTWECVACYDFSPTSEFLMDEIFDLAEWFD